MVKLNMKHWNKEFMEGKVKAHVQVCQKVF